jgi:hypothetical protein
MGNDYLGKLKDSVVAELGPRLLELGLNLAMPKIGDTVIAGITAGIANWKQELPPETLALFE